MNHLVSVGQMVLNFNEHIQRHEGDTLHLFIRSNVAEMTLIHLQ